MRRSLHRSTLLAVVATALAACGGGGGADQGGGPDPATVMPPSAPFYMEAAVNPEGERREDALAAARKIMRTDAPEPQLLGLFRDAVEREDLDVDYERDLKPWLGERAGFFIADPEADEPPTLFAVAASDTAKARSTVARLRRDAGLKLRTASHAGVEYDVDPDGTASGVIDDFLVFGNEPLFKQAVDASKGASLAEARAYKAATADLDGDRIATMYVVAAALSGLTADSDLTPEEREQTKQMQQALGFDDAPPMAVGLLADGEHVGIQSELSLAGASEAYERFTELTGGAAVPLVADAPADAWIAYGIPDAGGLTRTLLTTFAGTAGSAAITNSIRESTGLDLERDLLAWMGDAALFARGYDESTLDGALVVEAKDAGAARRALPKIAEAVLPYAPGGEVEPTTIEGADAALRLARPSAGKAIILAVGRGRMVAALGEGAARAGLAPSERLGDTPEYEAVTESLGDGVKPAVYLSMPGALKMLESFGATSDPTFGKVRPYLEAFAAIASGGRREGDRFHSVAAARLK